IYAYNSDNNIFTYSSFTNNSYGLYFNSSSDGNLLEGVNASDNSIDGLRLYDSEVTSGSYLYETPTHASDQLIFTTFTNNGSNGVDMDSNAKAWLNKTIIEN